MKEVIRIKTNQKHSWSTQQITGQQLYFTSLLIYLTAAFLQNTTFSNFVGSRPFNLISYAVFVILVFKIFFYDRYKFSTNIVIGLCLFLAVTVWWKTKSNLILVMTGLILGMGHIDFNRVIRLSLQLNFWLLVAVIACAITGIIANLAFVADGRGTRYALGIIYPTDFAARVLYIILADVYLNYRTLIWRRYVIYAVIACVVKQVTDARLNFICMLLIIPVVALAKYAEKQHQNSQQLLAVKTVASYWVLTPILTAVALFMTVLYDPANHLENKIDHLLSGRLTFGHLAVDRYPISMLGQHVVEHGFGNDLSLFKQGSANYLFIDSSFVRLFVVYGIITAVIIVGIMMYISIKQSYYGNYALPAILLIVTLSSVVEQHLLEPTYNLWLLALIPTLNLTHLSEG